MVLDNLIDLRDLRLIRVFDLSLIPHQQTVAVAEYDKINLPWVSSPAADVVSFCSNTFALSLLKTRQLIGSATRIVVMAHVAFRGWLPGASGGFLCKRAGICRAQTYADDSLGRTV